MEKYRLGEMTWPEIKTIIEEGERIAIVPTATYEDHGHHLPIDTDVLLCTEVCERAAARIPDEVVLVPPIIHGYSPHHMDFPGTISIDGHTYIEYVKNVVNSLMHAGFTKILLVNGHGSNTPFNDVAARLAIVENKGKALCASVCYWATGPIKNVVSQLRESETGGMGHACEFETSLYLALKPEFVQMDKAVKDMNRHTTPHFWIDLIGGGTGAMSAVSLMEWWSSFSETGTFGDATLATKEKGEAFLEASIQGIIDVVREYAERPIPPRVDHRPQKGKEISL